MQEKIIEWQIQVGNKVHIAKRFTIDKNIINFKIRSNKKNKLIFFNNNSFKQKYKVNNIY